MGSWCPWLYLHGFNVPCEQRPMWTASHVNSVLCEQHPVWTILRSAGTEPEISSHHIHHEPSLFAGSLSRSAVKSSAFSFVAIITSSTLQCGVSKPWEDLEIKCSRLCELHTVSFILFFKNSRARSPELESLDRRTCSLWEARAALGREGWRDQQPFAKKTGKQLVVLKKNHEDEIKHHERERAFAETSKVRKLKH